MKRIPFDISLRPQIEAGEYSVQTRDGKEVGLFFNLHGDSVYPIRGMITGYSFATKWTNDGKVSIGKENADDLFLVPKEQPLTEFEYNVASIIETNLCQVTEDGSMRIGVSIDNLTAKKIVQEILELAKKELRPEFDREMDKLLEETDKVVYEKGYNKGYKDGMEMWRPTTYQITEHVPCYAPNGICTNIHKDCINCPKDWSIGTTTNFGKDTFTQQLSLKGNNND